MRACVPSGWLVVAGDAELRANSSGGAWTAGWNHDTCSAADAKPGSSCVSVAPSLASWSSFRSRSSCSAHELRLSDNRLRTSIWTSRKLRLHLVVRLFPFHSFVIHSSTLVRRKSFLEKKLWFGSNLVEPLIHRYIHGW